MALDKHEKTFKDFKQELLEKISSYTQQESDQQKKKEADDIYNLIENLTPENILEKKQELQKYRDEHVNKSLYKGKLLELHEKLVELIDQKIGKIVSEVSQKNRRISMPWTRPGPPDNAQTAHSHNGSAKSNQSAAIKYKELLAAQQANPNLQKLKNEIRPKLKSLRDLNEISEEQIQNFELIESIKGIGEFYNALHQDRLDVIGADRLEQFNNLYQQIGAEIASYESDPQNYVPSSKKEWSFEDLLYGLIQAICDAVSRCIPSFGNSNEQESPRKPGSQGK